MRTMFERNGENKCLSIAAESFPHAPDTDLAHKRIRSIYSSLPAALCRLSNSDTSGHPLRYDRSQTRLRSVDGTPCACIDLVNNALNKWLTVKSKILLLVLLLGVPGAMFLARQVLVPVNTTARSISDEFVAAELRAELLRIYQKRYAYPTNLDSLWNDPEFKQILQMSFVMEDRSGAFAYESTGPDYEFRFTNGTKLIIERGTRGVASREVMQLK